MPHTRQAHGPEQGSPDVPLRHLHVPTWQVTPYDAANKTESPLPLPDSFPQQPRRVVITGVGVVSPNGIGAEAYAEACVAGRSGLSFHELDAPHLKTTAVGRVRGFDPTTVMDASEARRVPRMIPMALAASREALEMAGVAFAPDDFEAQRKMGVSLGTGGGGLAFVEEQYKTFFAEGKGSL